jgi:L-asparaginase
MFIQILTTGGTIDKIYFDAKSEFEVGDPMIGEVLKEAGVTFEYGVQQLMRKDSIEVTDEDRQLMYDTVEKSECDRFVITHGTDTMVQTGQVLMPLAESRVIVLVGALSPARFRSTDAIFNIGFAMAAAQILPFGVYVAMNGHIFNPNAVVKNRAQNRFEEI